MVKAHYVNSDNHTVRLPSGLHRMWRALRVPLVMACALMLAATLGSATAVSTAGAATLTPMASAPTATAPTERASVAPGDIFTKPQYLPFRVNAWNGCVVNNCMENGKPDHGYWALDFTATRGDLVYAAGGGIAHIEKAPDPGRCLGGTIWIDHGGGDTSRYVHLGTIRVGEGAVVDQNTPIATFGGDHCNSNSLHFSVRPNGPRPVEQGVNPGELRACLSNSYPVTFPSAIGFGSWNDIPFRTRTVSSNGTSCWKTPDQAGAPSGVKVKLKKGRMLVSWTPTTWNRHLVRAYKIGYRHISTRGKWTKQYFVTVGAGATTATIKQQIFKSTWEAAVWSYDDAGASPGVVKRVKIKKNPK